MASRTTTYTTLSPAQAADAVARIRAGESYRTVAANFGVKVNSIQYHVKRASAPVQRRLPPPPPVFIPKPVFPWPAEAHELGGKEKARLAIAAQAQGISDDEIVSKLGWSSISALAAYKKTYPDLTST